MISASVVCVLVGMTGVVLQLLTHAATPTASIEAENGTVSSPATKVSVSGASGGQAVKFGSGSGGSGTWTLLYDVNLATEPSGTTYSTGVRGTDSSYNRKQQVSYGASGMTITAQDISGTIYSADVMMKGLPMPDHHAIEFDTKLTGYLGVGMFPAAWERPASAGTGTGAGEGEHDLWEYSGGYVGQNNEWKMTNITTPYTTNGIHQNQVVDQFAPDFQTAMGTRTPIGVTMHWRAEYTLNTGTLYLNGTQIAQITKAGYDATKNGGVLNPDYDNTNYGYDRWLQFETPGKTWYPRFTYQVGNGANSSNAGNVPGSWTQSQMIISNLKIYKLTSE